MVAVVDMLWVLGVARREFMEVGVEVVVGVGFRSGVVAEVGP